MKRILFSSIATFSLGFSITPNIYAAEVGPRIYSDGELLLCQPTRLEEYIQFKKEGLKGSFKGIDQFNITEDWRKQGMDSESFPLSTPLIINNPIKGKTIGVFDRNYNKTFRVASFFGRNIIKIKYQTVATGRFGLGRSTSGSEIVNSLGIKNKDGYLIVNGCEGVFEVNKELADALKNYELVNGKAFVLLSSEGSTGLRINEIGPETVKAWKVVYSNWNPLFDGRRKNVIPINTSLKKKRFFSFLK